MIRPWRWWRIAPVVLLLLLTADYLLYPILARPGGHAFNRGENALWLRYWYYFGRRTDADVRSMTRRLKENQIRYAYFHVRSITREGKLQFHYPAAARRLVAAVHHDAPGVKAIAWIYAGNRRGLGEVDLANPDVRRNMASEARWLVTTCGFDGVQWDYEICDSGDAGFPSLMRETRAALHNAPLLSAAVPLWVPQPFRRWGWGDEDFARVAATCDQVAVMAYDSGIYLPRGYVWLVHEQVVHVTQAVRRANPRCRVLIGLPTYGKGGLSHHAWAENIRLALKGVREGVADPRAARAAFAGVALFADYTTQPEEWQIYHSLWLAAEHESRPPDEGTGSRLCVGAGPRTRATASSAGSDRTPPNRESGADRPRFPDRSNCSPRR